MILCSNITITQTSKKSTPYKSIVHSEMGKSIWPRTFSQLLQQFTNVQHLNLNRKLKMPVYMFRIIRRTNTPLTNYIFMKDKRIPSPNCRHCFCKIETLGHVLNSYMLSSTLIQIHHNIINILKELKKLHND